MRLIIGHIAQTLVIGRGNAKHGFDSFIRPVVFIFLLLTGYYLGRKTFGFGQLCADFFLGGKFTF
ncbi:hypothetical protein D3C72_2351140 [compost metagenome]